MFSKELVNLLAIGQLDSLEVGDIKPHFLVEKKIGRLDVQPSQTKIMLEKIKYLPRF